jgi:AraC-like DNA-binding protein
MMNTRIEADIIGMLRHIVCALQAFAKMHEVDLNFQSDNEELIISYEPEEISGVITKLICRVVAYTPPKQSLILKTALVKEPDRKFLRILIRNTGINLSRVAQITEDFKRRVSIKSPESGGTIFELELEFQEPFNFYAEISESEKTNSHHILPIFYTKVRRHLQSHFTKTENLIALLSSGHPKDAAFLQKVNILILTNIESDGFNANHLSNAMGMSRAQLYRKLQTIIRQAPGCYIQTLRIQKAKELLETTDMRVGEVAFKTGFQTPSHFTRIFIKHYGVRPSLYCRQIKNVTNR